MMIKQNLKRIQHDARKNNKFLNYRRISLPKRNFTKHVRRPFRGEFMYGTFRNDIYSSMSPIFVAWLYIKNILIFCSPAIMLHGVMYFIHRFSIYMMGDEYSAPAEAFQILMMAYAICAFFAFRRINDHMAYYNNTMLVSKYDINRKYKMNALCSPDPQEDKELVVMDHYRKRFNKHSLFPSVRELAVEEQLFEIMVKRNKQPELQNAEIRRERLNLNNRRQEHAAAKQIADWKQSLYGGKNEYDEMVAKYKHRTVPAIREIIEDIQSMSNIYA